MTEEHWEFWTSSTFFATSDGVVETVHSGFSHIWNFLISLLFETTCKLKQISVGKDLKLKSHPSCQEYGGRDLAMNYLKLLVLSGTFTYVIRGREDAWLTTINSNVAQGRLRIFSPNILALDFISACSVSPHLAEKCISVLTRTWKHQSRDSLTGQSLTNEHNRTNPWRTSRHQINNLARLSQMTHCFALTFDSIKTYLGNKQMVGKSFGGISCSPSLFSFNRPCL